MQVAAEKASKGLSKKVRALVQSRGKLARHVAAWRSVVLRGGPARAMALARMSIAREAVVRSRLPLLYPGSAADVVATVVASLIPGALQGLQTLAPSSEWWCRLWLLRWSVKTTQVRRRWLLCQAISIRSSLRWWRAQVEQAALWLLRLARPELARVRWVASASAEIESVAFWASGVGLLVPWEPGGVGGRRFLCLKACRAIVWPAISREAGAAHAWRAWTEAGGAKAMERETGKQRKVQETRIAARVVAQMIARGVQPCGLLSDMSSARRVVRATPRVQTRVLQNAEVGAGVRADGRGRWAVDQILRWRGGFREREALVRWLGFDRQSMLPHGDTWVPRSKLTADLREGGLIRPKRARTAARAPTPRPARARRVSRLEGLIPEGLLDEAAVRRTERLKRKAVQAEVEFAEEAGGRRRSRRRSGLVAE